MEKPKIVLTDLAYQKIMYWVGKANGEISGLGHVEVKGNEFHVLDAFLLPQKNGASHTDIEPEDLAKAEYERRDQPGSIQFWWHSHVNMSVFWSGTDKDTMKLLADGGWFINTVFNKRAEKRSALCMNKPVPVFIDEVETEVRRFLDKDLCKELEDSFKTNVTEHSYNYGGYSGNRNYSGYGGTNHDWQGNDWSKKKNGRKRRAYRMNSKCYLVGTGAEVDADECEVPDHLDFDKNPTNKNRQLTLVENQNKPVVPMAPGHQEDEGEDTVGTISGAVDWDAEMIDIIMRQYNCSEDTAKRYLEDWQKESGV